MKTTLIKTGTTAQWSVSIPNESGLLGAEFYNHGFVFDMNPSPHSLGATTSNAAKGVIGGAWQVTNSIGMRFNRIPAGTFTMGSPPGEPGRWLDEALHRVTLT